MREIRVRAWDERGKVMSRPMTIRDLTLYEHHFESYFPGHLARFKDLVWMEYIDRRDSKGMDICVRDIVTHPLCVKEPHSADEPCERFVGQIVYEANRGQYFAVGLKRSGRAITMEEAYKFEVIGNVYQNPELLS